MKQFQYTITDPIGIHARPAGLLSKAAKTLDSSISIRKNDGQSAGATRLIAGIKGGDVVTITAEGGDEDASIATMEQFFKNNL